MAQIEESNIQNTSQESFMGLPGGETPAFTTGYFGSDKSYS